MLTKKLADNPRYKVQSGDLARAMIRRLREEVIELINCPKLTTAQLMRLRELRVAVSFADKLTK
jgi:hypothetical protein